MVSFGIELKGASELRNVLENKLGKSGITLVMQRTLSGGGELVRKGTQKYLSAGSTNKFQQEAFNTDIPGAERTYLSDRNLRRIEGDLARSIIKEVYINAVGLLECLVGSDKIQARIHELGGIILPKKAAALAFETENGFVITKKVVMPARPWLLPALLESTPEIEKLLSSEFFTNLGGENAS